MALDGLAHLALLTNTIMAAAPVVDHHCTSLFKWLHLEPEEDDEKDRAVDRVELGTDASWGVLLGLLSRPVVAADPFAVLLSLIQDRVDLGTDASWSVLLGLLSRPVVAADPFAVLLSLIQSKQPRPSAATTQAILLVSFCVAVTQSLAALQPSSRLRPSSLSSSTPSSRASASSSRTSVPFLGMFLRPTPVSAADAAAAAAAAASEPAGKEWAEWGVLACCLPYLRRAYILIHYLGIMPLREPPLVDHRVNTIKNLSPQVLLADWLRRSLALPSVASVLRLMASANSEGPIPLPPRVSAASSSSPWQLSRMFASWNLPSDPPRLVRAPTQPSFHPLPEIYQDLLLSTMNKKCRNCGQEPPNPAVCLCCGELLCYHSSCCHSDGRGECYRHALRENGGTGLFLVMRSTQLVLIHGVHICAGLSIYLDSHGEDDAYMRRGRPLYLSHSRLAELSRPDSGSLHHAPISSRTAFPISRSRSVRIDAAAGGSGKGFGSGPSNKSPAKSKGSKSSGGAKKSSGPSVAVPEDPKITRLVQRLEEKSSSNPSPTRGHPLVDQRAAAKGRVDFVKVEGWEAAGSAAGSELGPDEIGNLKVKSFTPGTTSQGYEARAEADQQPRQQWAEGDPAAPQVGLYERLVRHLQVLESQGKLSVARAKGEPPLPSFDRWRFGAKRFGQYLVDQMHVHEALDKAVVQALGGKTGGESGRDGGDDVSGATRALSLVGPAIGLSRSEALKSDIAALSKVCTTRGAAAAGSEVAAGGGEASAAEPVVPGSATTETIAYVRLIEQLGQKASASANNSQEQGEQDQSTPSFLSLKSSTTGSSGAGSAAISPADAARLKLFTHTFTLLVTHLTNGMRIGAKAVECLPSLRAAKAVRFFQAYPETVGDPMKAFRAAVDEAGRGMSEGEVELVEGELGPAMVKASLLLKVLAVEEREAAVSAP
ncbi:unnamed protein product [Closterium sp. Yama58-4]|nr:unnamed protein product [Closterium sp. Yama58-4]